MRHPSWDDHTPLSSLPSSSLTIVLDIMHTFLLFSLVYGFSPCLGFYHSEVFVSFTTNAYFKLNLRLAITRCADDFINYSTLSAEDLMQWFVEYLHTQGEVLQSYLE